MAAHTLRVARKACPQAEALCGAVDVRNLPFRSASFDAVMCCYLLELLSRQDIQLTLREIRRVLRPGGNFSLVVIGQNVKMFNRMYTLGGSLVPAFWGRQVESSVPELIRQTGMRVVTDRFVRQGFYPSRVLVAENAAAHSRAARTGR